MIGLPSSSNSSSPGSGRPSRRASITLSPVREAVELRPDGPERPVEVSADDVGDAELDRIDLRDEPPVRQVQPSIEIASAPTRGAG